MSRETLRRAAEAALTTRVDLRDDIDADFGTALDELLDLVVERGEDPDVALAPADSPKSLSPLRRGAAPPSRPRGGPRPAYVRPEPPAGDAPWPRSRAAIACRPGGARRLDRRREPHAQRLPHRRPRPARSRRAAGGAPPCCSVPLVWSGLCSPRPRRVREPLREPWGGELDVEATVDNVIGKVFPEPGDWIVQRRVDRRHQVVLMVDTSLSMSGENMAIAAVAARCSRSRCIPRTSPWSSSRTRRAL